MKRTKLTRLVISVLTSIMVIGILGTTGFTSEAKSKTKRKSTPKAGVDYAVTDLQFDYGPDTFGDMRYWGIVEVTNTSQRNLYLEDCTFDIEDMTGHLVETNNFISTCPNIIAPGEKGYFYTQMGGSSFDSGVTGESYQLVPNIKIYESTEAPVEFPITDTSSTIDSYGNLKITGRVTNNTAEDEALYLQVVFYDQSGRVMDVSGTNVFDFDAGTTESFDVSSMFSHIEEADVGKIANYKLIARKTHYQFD